MLVLYSIDFFALIRYRDILQLLISDSDINRYQPIPINAAVKSTIKG